jgi:hypothetical protein
MSDEGWDLALENIPICVLDYDGVVHHDAVYYKPGVGVFMNEPGHTLFEWSHILADLLEPYPEVRIVLSTSWARMRGFEFAKSALPEPLRSRVVGATFNNRDIQKIDFDFMSRATQVLWYVQRRGLNRWFAIDDDVEGWPASDEKRLVKTQSHLGLSEPAVQAEIRRALALL